jgi:hypothetical protein
MTFTGDIAHFGMFNPESSLNGRSTLSSLELVAHFLFGLHFGPEDGGSKFHCNISELLLDYTALFKKDGILMVTAVRISKPIPEILALCVSVEVETKGFTDDIRFHTNYLIS